MEGVLRGKYGCRVQCSFNNRKIFTHRIDGQTSIAVENLYIYKEYKSISTKFKMGDETK